LTRSGLMVVAFVVVGLVPACRESTESQIRVGFISAGANPSEPSRAARLATIEVNSSGGIANHLVALRSEVTSLDPVAALDSVSRMIDEGCRVIVGPQTSAEMNYVATTVTAAQVPAIGFNATSAAFSGNDAAYAYILRTAPSDLYQARLIASRAIGPWGCQNLALIAQMDLYGEPLADEIARFYETSGGAVVAREDIDPNAADYHAALDRIAAAAPECVVLAAFGTPSARLFVQWNDGSIRPVVRWIGTESHRSQVFLDRITDHAVIDGMVGTDIAPIPSTPEYDAFRERFVSSYGIAPEPIDARKYDATALALRDAVLDVSRPPGTSIGPGQLGLGLSVLERGGEIDYIGASGGVDLDEVGDVLADYVTWTFDSAMDAYVIDEFVPAGTIPANP